MYLLNEWRESNLKKKNWNTNTNLRRDPPSKWILRELHKPHKTPELLQGFSPSQHRMVIPEDPLHLATARPQDY